MGATVFISLAPKGNLNTVRIVHGEACLRFGMRNFDALALCRNDEKDQARIGW